MEGTIVELEKRRYVVKLIPMEEIEKLAKKNRRTCDFCDVHKQDLVDCSSICNKYDVPDEEMGLDEDGEPERYSHVAVLEKLTFKKKFEQLKK